MDGIGSLQLAWTTGYKGSRAEYINQDVICLKCGDNIKFIGEDGHQSVYTAPPGESIGPLAIHGINKLFAYSENAIKPRIFVLQYPSFLKVSTLPDGAQLEYLSLTFSVSDYLATVSGVPDYQLIIWRYTDMTKLFVQSLPRVAPSCVCFNPGNWRQLAICTPKELTVWNVEQNNTAFIMKKQSVKLPAEGICKSEPVSRSSSRRSRVNIQLPLSAIAGVTGDDFVKFEDYQDEKEHIVPVNLCWTTSGDLIVSSARGQLLRVDVENCNLTLLSLVSTKPEISVREMSNVHVEESQGHVSENTFRHQDSRSLHDINQAKQEDNKGGQTDGSKVQEGDKVAKEGESSPNQPGEQEAKKPEEKKVDPAEVILPGSLNCIALHRRGLFAAGSDGIIRVLQLSANQFSVVEHQEVGVPITSMSFNPSHHTLAVGSPKGSIHLCNPDSISNVKVLFDINYGNFLSVCGLATKSNHCVTLRESGEVQVWKSDNGQLLGSLPIGVKASSMATSPLAHLAVVGSETGYAYIIDLNNPEHPRIVHVIHLHQNPIRLITFNEVGQIFLTGSTDGNIFVVDGRPSKHFEPLGYVPCPGDVKGLSTFMKDGETRVVVTCDVSETPSSKSPANKLLSFVLPANLHQDLKSKHASLKCDFKDEAINRLSYNFPDPVFGVALTDDHYVYVLNQGTKYLQIIQIPQELQKKIRLEEEAPETVAKSVIASRLEYRRRRQQVVSPAINTRRRMSVIGAGMADQFGSGGPMGGGPAGGMGGMPEGGGLRMSISGFGGASGAPGAGPGVGGFSPPEGVGRRLSIFGSMADQGPPPEPIFISPEHKEVSSLDLLKIRRASVAEGQMSGIMKLVTIMKTSESLIDKDTSEILAAQEAEKNKDPYLVVSTQVPGHQLSGGCLLMSLNHKWLASGGGDGQIAVRAIAELEKTVTVSAHNYWRGGVLNCCFSPDSQSIFTTGFDGTLCCFRWNYLPGGQAKAQVHVDAAASLLVRLRDDQVVEDRLLAQIPTWDQKEPAPKTDKGKKLDDEEKEIEKAIENDLIYTPAPPVPAEDATWQEIKRIEAQIEEEKKFADTKMKLRIEIREMRRKLQQMMRDNEVVPQIERLPHHEFDLDVDEQKRLQEQCEVEVQKMREEKEFQNIAKMFLAENIRKECWDEMLVKGRGIVAFNSVLEVYNYPMKERLKLELRELEIVQAQRRVEIAEQEIRKELTDAMTKAPKDPANMSEEELVETDDSRLQLLREKMALLGSLGFEVGGDSELFYNQFELVTREQKQNQIVLLQDAIYRIRTRFNKEFDEVLLKKEQEISKIKEKNKRIRKILQDLGFPDDVYEPELGSIEKPEMLLTTTDEEVKVEKFLTPDQWKKMEEDRKVEEERRLKERGDNWRERGLDQMMGGVLEIKKEDELKKDIPIPLFMQEKKEEEWTDDDRRAADEYKLKVKELEEERDKFKKQLELELKKLQGVVLEGTQAFDDVLHQLFMKKVKTESVIFQEELKILRLRYSLLTEEEFMNYEKELIQCLEKVKLAAHAATQSVNQARKELDDYRNEYDIHVADDKVHERMFRREFQNLPTPFVDQLLKHYKKRPRGQKAKTYESQAYDTASSYPFSDRPSTARRNEEARYALNQAMAELNQEKNIPEGVDNQSWEHLCAYRMEKIEKELQIKQKALTLAEMQAFVQKRAEEEEKLKMEIEEVLDTISKLHESRQIFNSDLEVQLLLKQGQVEVDPGQFIPNFKTTLLIHREVVEELNKKIRQLGESKISSMVESKDFRKGIVVLEWEHKKMKMEMEDLKNRMRDIINMKVTREIQAFLASEDYDSMKNQEIATLEQTIAMQKRHHERRVKEKKKALLTVRRSTLQMLEKNNDLDAELERLNVTVNERRHIHEVHPEKLNDMDREDRYRDIVQRRKLIDLAKAQAQEVAMLRTELERLRMRTFPALVQLDR